MAAAGTTLLGGDQRQVDSICNEVGLEQQAVLLALVREVVRLAGETRLEVIRGVEDEVRVVIQVDDRRQIS